jgi:hypothetical protein
MDDLMERKQEDLDRLTVAFANGYAIAMDSGARSQWQAARASPGPAPDAEAAARQSASIARLSKLFPGAVKAKAN